MRLNRARIPPSVARARTKYEASLAPPDVASRAAACARSHNCSATAAIQGVLITLAYALARVPFPTFFSLVTVFGLFVPVIGTALVWAPICGVLAVSGRFGATTALFCFCLAVALVTENVVKPFIMRGQIEMHIGLIFISVLSGLAAFGSIGILTGALVATFFLAMLRLYQRDCAEPQVPSAMIPPPLSWPRCASERNFVARLRPEPTEAQEPRIDAGAVQFRLGFRLGASTRSRSADQCLIGLTLRTTLAQLHT